MDALDFEFGNPHWVHAYWVVLFLGIALTILELRKRTGGGRFVSAQMQKRLARTNSLLSRLSATACLVGGLALIVLALMRPQYGFMEKKIPHVGAQIMVCLDVSRSMLAEDATPNRLERAKSELEVLLNYVQGDQVGLIAFAGKATVLSPMTTDLSFLKMVLREASPTSVGRGGTRLEEPIRRALAGFRDQSDMSQVIVLITDGEDHDSKPLDAAREAAERGIRIITIGFGHEQGSRIEITDPETGLKEYVRDANGKEVITRLDIDMLKKIAEVSRGAFIPARVGSLDAESINRDLIRPLTRGTGETKIVVRNEAFQWPLLGGIVMLIVSLLMANRLAFSTRNFSDWLEENSLLRLVPWLFVFLLSDTVSAQTNRVLLKEAQAAGLTEPKKAAVPVGKSEQDTTGSAGSPEENEDTEAKGLGGEFSSRTIDDLVPEDPLECYNMACDVLQSDTAFAEKLLEAARRQAEPQAELRFRAAYNLGWVKINQANTDLKQRPEEALKQLNAAADWFREAIRLRPGHSAARENLEITLRRIVQLQDSLNRADPDTFEKELDRLIQRQTGMVDAVRQIAESATQSSNNLEWNDELKKMVRLAGVDQRLILSDLQETIRKTTEMIEAYRQNKSGPQTGSSAGNPGPDKPDQEFELKIAQVEQALAYCDRSAQRLGQSRSQLRLKNPARAALRAALGLDELKRARDQLRSPAEILRQIIADSKLLNEQTRSLTAGKNSIAAFLGRQPEVPQWLNVEYLQQFQKTQAERTAEFGTLLSGVVSRLAKHPGTENGADESVQLQRERLQTASSRIQSANQEFSAATTSMNETKLQAALSHQERAIRFLNEAYEEFADLKGLLELSYRTQTTANQELSAANNLAGDVFRTAVSDIAQRLDRNLQRIQRINRLIGERIRDAEQAREPGAATGANQQPLSPEQLKSAAQLGAAIEMDLGSLVNQLKTSGTEENRPENMNEILEQSDRILQGIAGLRRLFFSIAEHLAETASRQDQLNRDVTRLFDTAQRRNRSAAKTDPAGNDEPKKPVPEGNDLLPLASRQRELASISGEIGSALQEMAAQSGQQIADGSSSQPQMQQKFDEASKLVQEGRLHMLEADSALQSDLPDRDSVESEQEKALEKLAEALRILSPDRNDPSDEDKGSGAQPDPNQPEEEQHDDAGRKMLQRIRDREAQRRRNRERNRIQEQVEKDW